MKTSTEDVSRRKSGETAHVSCAFPPYSPQSSTKPASSALHLARVNGKTVRFSSRRRFLKGVTALLAVPTLWLMGSLTKRDDSLPENSEAVLNVPLTEGNGIRFFADAIVINSGDKISVFSSKCPHLGCRINQAEGNEIVCPCHGSRFDLQGQMLRGPANHGLQPLDYRVDRANAVLHVNLTK